MLYLGKYIVVEYLQDQSHNDTEDGGYQSHFHTRSHNGRTDVARNLYLVESHYHTYYRTEETQRGCHSNEKSYPRTAFLQISTLYTAVGSHAALYVFDRAINAEKSLIADRSHRATGILAKFFRLFNVFCNYQVGQLSHKTLCVNLRKAKIDNAFYTESQAQHQG